MSPSLGEPKKGSMSWSTPKWVHLLGPSFVGVAGTLPPSAAPVGHMGLALSLPQAGLGEGQGINNMG